MHANLCHLWGSQAIQKHLPLRSSKANLGPTERHAKTWFPMLGLHSHDAEAGVREPGLPCISRRII